MTEQSQITNGGCVTPTIEVVHIVQDRLGGVASVTAKLSNRKLYKDLKLKNTVIRLRDTRWRRSYYGKMEPDNELVFSYSSQENIYSVLPRLNKLIPKTASVIVANDAMELQLSCVYDLPQTIFLVVHNDYSVELAKHYAGMIDGFITFSAFHHDKLISLFPERQNSIFHIPYGVTLSPTVRKPSNGCLRLIFVARMVESKGIFILPEIDKFLEKAGIKVRWSVIGDGPSLPYLQKIWCKSHVTYYGQMSNDDVLQLYPDHDIFVFPSYSEGFPVVLLEAMSAGVVPITTSLPSGIPELVNCETGFQVGAGNSEGFAAAILMLDKDRDLLDGLSSGCRRLVEKKFVLEDRLQEFSFVFRTHKRTKREKVSFATSRLDQPWLPNGLVKLIRRLYWG